MGLCGSCFVLKYSSVTDSSLHFDDAHLAFAKRVVLLTVFLDILGFGIIIPQLAIYAAQYSATPEQIGLLASSYSAMQFVFAPFWGRLSDRIGRRPVLVWSIFGTALGYVLFAYAGALWMLFASRILDGITGANISTAQAYLSDVTPPKERTKTFAIFGAIFGIGFAVGPLIGGWLANLPAPWGGNFGLGWFTAALSFINWGLALWRLPETLTPEMRRQNAERQRAQGGRFTIINVAGFRRAFAIPGLRLIIITGFIGTLAFATLQGTYTTFILVRYARPEVQERIKANPEAAVAEARRHMSHNEKPEVAHEGGGPQINFDDDKPFDKELGGDFQFSQPAPVGLTWRHVEKVLVRHETTDMVKWIFTTIGVLALVVQGGLIRPLKKRFSDIDLLLAGTLMVAIALAFVPLPHEFIWQFPGAALMAIGNGISAPVFSALVSLLAPESERGEVMGVFQSTQSLSRILGPQMGGVLFGMFSPSAPYFVGAAIMLLSFFVALGLRGMKFEAADSPPEPVKN
jgi:MFS transporter, DHA1 family, tetracycline resistance protein